MGYKAELGWAAGFLDGEGYVGVRRDSRPGRNPGLQFAIEQADRRPLERFAKAVRWEGRIYTRPDKRAPNRRQMYRIAMFHKDTVRVMRLLWPYMSEPKREQLLKAVKEIDDALA
jgi:hypothetical protein